MCHICSVFWGEINSGAQHGTLKNACLYFKQKFANVDIHCF